MGVAGIGLFCGAVTVFFYALMLRLVSRERFDNVVVWSQVGLSVFFFFGYQLLPRLMRPLLQIDFRRYLPYLAFYPPAWYAGLDASPAGRACRRNDNPAEDYYIYFNVDDAFAFAEAGENLRMRIVPLPDGDQP